MLWKRRTIAKEVEDQLFEILNKNAILFGSRRWGVATNKSDWDYIIEDANSENLMRFLKQHNIDWKYKHSTYPHALFGTSVVLEIYLNKKQIQVQYYYFALSKHYKRMYQAIKVMDTYAKHMPVTPKSRRVVAFEGFVKYFLGKDTKTMRPFFEKYLPEFII